MKWVVLSRGKGLCGHKLMSTLRDREGNGWTTNSARVHFCVTQRGGQPTTMGPSSSFLGGTVETATNWLLYRLHLYWQQMHAYIHIKPIKPIALALKRVFGKIHRSIIYFFFLCDDTIISESEDLVESNSRVLIDLVENIWLCPFIFFRKFTIRLVVKVLFTKKKNLIESKLRVLINMMKSKSRV